MLRFTKMHGAGNDYIYVDCFEKPPPADVSALARNISDRHTGVGADGLILIGPSKTADARMRMWNADGSAGEMCGNGIRCVAKYVYDRGIAKKEELQIETDRGVLALQLTIEEGRVAGARVNMGRPILKSADIPTTLPGDPPIDVNLELDADKREASVVRLRHQPTSTGRLPASRPITLTVTCVSMGNPHCVTFIDDLTDDWVLGVGPLVEMHPAFPNRVNVEFVQVVSPTEIVMRVWERGSGETRACGSGGCAALVAGVLSGRTERHVRCRLPGGELQLEWSPCGTVYMSGPAAEVFNGEWPTSFP